MFSDKELANYLNDNFECSWQMLKPVPIMSVDFGDGRIVRRSMHGNVASYVCTADKTIVDVIPGIYGPRTYQGALVKLHGLTLALKSADRLIASRQIARHHDAEIKRINSEMNLISAGRIFGFKYNPSTVKAEPELEALGDKNYLNGILADNAVSETTRRLTIHKMLMKAGESSPEQITKQVYKNCLDLDLDDPYLGLSAALVSSYPGETD